MRNYNMVQMHSYQDQVLLSKLESYFRSIFR